MEYEYNANGDLPFSGISFKYPEKICNCVKMAWAKAHTVNGKTVMVRYAGKCVAEFI